MYGEAAAPLTDIVSSVLERLRFARFLAMAAVLIPKIESREVC